jgi:phage FluMu protein Com
MKTSLKCSCGQRVLRRDVMQQGFYMQHVGPSFVYVKFRCSRCKKLGQQVVKQDEWEEGVLNDATTEQTCEEKQTFAQMGSITLDEMKRFHLALEKLDTLPRDLFQDETT